MLEIVFVAFSLALDAAAVSVAVSAACPQGGVKQALRLALWFGSFQFLMPLLGFHLGQALAARLTALTPWLAFTLLTYIGGKLLWDAFSPAPPNFHLSSCRITALSLLLLALATSLDALATGVSLAVMALPLWLSCALIGFAAFALSLLAALAGRGFGRRFHRVSSALGGTALLLIAARFLLRCL